MRLAWDLLGKGADACGLMHAGLGDDLLLVRGCELTFEVHGDLDCLEARREVVGLSVR